MDQLQTRGCIHYHCNKKHNITDVRTCFVCLANEWLCDSAVRETSHKWRTGPFWNSEAQHKTGLKETSDIKHSQKRP